MTYTTVKQELKALDDNIRHAIKIADAEANKALDNNDISELDAIEEIIKKLYRIDGIIYTQIQSL